MRAKLTELLKTTFNEQYEKRRMITHQHTADYLIANGVVVQEWVPVSEKLPEPFVTVIVQVPGETPCPTVKAGFLNGSGVWYINMFGYDPSEVTHWMPMPEPPKEANI